MDYEQNLKYLTRLSVYVGSLAGVVILISAAIPLIYDLISPDFHLASAEPSNKFILVFFLSMLGGIGIRYFRLDYIINAVKSRNKPLVVRRIKHVTLITGVYTSLLAIATCAASIYLQSLTTYGYFMFATLFSLGFNLPRKFHIEEWLTYAEFPFSFNLRC